MKRDEEHRQLIETVKAIREDNKQEYERMDRNLQYYEGKLWNKSDSEFDRNTMANGRSEVQFNTIFANI